MEENGENIYLVWLVCVWCVSAHVCVFVEKKGKEGEYRKTCTLRKETASETVYSAEEDRETERGTAEKNRPST